jgi:stage V sporulation protein D (sporulation-specific penicillin-binding protein)
LISLSREAATTLLSESGLHSHFIGDGDTVLAQYPLPTSDGRNEISRGQPIMLYMGCSIEHSAGEITVPDFTGRTMREVGSIAAQLGLTPHTRTAGGVAYDQHPEAGSVVRRGSIVRVNYR